MELASLMSPALASRFFTTSVTWEALHLVTVLPRYCKGKDQEGQLTTERHSAVTGLVGDSGEKVEEFL